MKRRGMTPLRDPSDIPVFASEAEERAFWDTHELTEEFLERMGPVPDDELPPVRPRTRPIAVRFDQDVLRRLRALAGKKGKGYQTILKEFVLERLYEEEKREGILPGAGRGQRG